MAMVFCRGCGKEIHELAPACPHCGIQTGVAEKLDGYASYADVPWYRKNWFAILCALLFVPGLLVALLSGGVYYERKGQLRKYSTAAKVFLVVWCVVWILAVFGGGDAPKSQLAQVQAEQSLIEVSAMEIAQAYGQNEARGDALYKGRVLRVTGVVDGITKDIADDTVVDLRSGAMFQFVKATMSSEAEQFAVSLSKGQKVILICEGAGEVVSSPLLSNCRGAN